MPRFDFAGERDTLVRYAEQKGPAELANYRTKKNLRSIDGLPGLKDVSG